MSKIKSSRSDTVAIIRAVSTLARKLDTRDPSEPDGCPPSWSLHSSGTDR